MELFMAADSLRYALGHDVDLPEDLTGGYDFFRKLCDQTATKDLPPAPALYDGPTVTLRSTVLGCRITLETPNQNSMVELAESILAGLESLLSTKIQAVLT